MSSSSSSEKELESEDHSEDSSEDCDSSKSEESSTEESDSEESSDSEEEEKDINLPFSEEYVSNIFRSSDLKPINRVVEFFSRRKMVVVSHNSSKFHIVDIESGHILRSVDCRGISDIIKLSSRVFVVADYGETKSRFIDSGKLHKRFQISRGTRLKKKVYRLLRLDDDHYVTSNRCHHICVIRHSTNTLVGDFFLYKLRMDTHFCKSTKHESCFYVSSVDYDSSSSDESSCSSEDEDPLVTYNITLFDSRSEVIPYQGKGERKDSSKSSKMRKKSRKRETSLKKISRFVLPKVGKNRRGEKIHDIGCFLSPKSRREILVVVSTISKKTRIHLFVSSSKSLVNIRVIKEYQDETPLLCTSNFHLIIGDTKRSLKVYEITEGKKIKLKKTNNNYESTKSLKNVVNEIIPWNDDGNSFLCVCNEKRDVCLVRVSNKENSESNDSEERTNFVRTRFLEFLVKDKETIKVNFLSTNQDEFIPRTFFCL